jgi:hypothetical protein
VIVRGAACSDPPGPNMTEPRHHINDAVARSLTVE